MKYTSLLLNRFISWYEDINKLTLTSFEIENIKKLFIPKVKIWKILEVEKHPNADKLFICKVDIWEVKIIVTWANNVKKWNLVPVALPWTKIWDVTLWEKIFKWIKSEWMLCSTWELWLFEEDWILILDWIVDEKDVGKYLDEILPLNRFIVEVDNNAISHRPDLWSHFWFALELKQFWYKYSSIDDILNTVKYVNIDEALQFSKKTNRKIIVNTPDLRSYVLLHLDWVNIWDSGLIEKVILKDLDMNYINNWVDFSNIFMFLYWQPIHFFDASKVNWDIIIRNAIDWEKFIWLDWKEYILNSQDIVISDRDKILALAWIIWSEYSKVDKETKEILVEIANFDNVKIRKTSKRLWIRTMASMIFEKNINPNWSLYSFLFLLDELKKYWFDFNFNWLDYYWKFTKEQIQIDFNKMSKFVFWYIDTNFIEISKKNLSSIWFEIWEKINIPIRRSDIKYDVDIYEEAARLYWYDNIPKQSFSWNITFCQNEFINKIRKIQNRLKSLGFIEVETYPWINQEYFTDDWIKLLNPIAPWFKVLRRRLLYNLLEVILKNYRNYDEIKIYEIWKIYTNWKTEVENLKEYIDLYPDIEKTVLWIWYLTKQDTFDKDPIVYLKSILSEFWEFEIKKTNYEEFFPNRQGDVYYNWKKIWYIWEISPHFYYQYKLYWYKVGFLEIEIDHYYEKNYIYDTLSEQVLWKDICLVLDINSSYKRLIDEIKKLPFIKDIVVKDLYLLWDKKSITISFKIKEDKITSELINKYIKEIVEVAENLWARLRQ